MKILITGCNGQLGTELRRCLEHGASELAPLSGQLRRADVMGVDLPSLDISSLADVKRCVQQARPEIIINCAAYTNVDGCEADPDSAMKANAIGARNVALAARCFGAKLIHISTDYVFSGDGIAPYGEWDVCEPRSVYGASKLLGERYVQEFCDRYFILRTAWLYGCTGNNFVKTILHLARENGTVKVVNDQIGNPTNAADLAHHILKLAVTDEFGVYHCTNNGECSWYEFAVEFLRLSGVGCTVTPCTTEQFPRLARRPAYSSLDNRMLRCTVGDDMRHWREAIAAYLRQCEASA